MHMHVPKPTLLVQLFNRWKWLISHNILWRRSGSRNKCVIQWVSHCPDWLLFLDLCRNARKADAGGEIVSSLKKKLWTDDTVLLILFFYSLTLVTFPPRVQLYFQRKIILLKNSQTSHFSCQLEEITQVEEELCFRHERPTIEQNFSKGIICVCFCKEWTNGKR